MNALANMLTDPFMIRALIAALLVGAAAPIIGTFLVQRRLALLGDGIGHVALTGVALGWLIGNWAGLAPGALAIPGAIVASIVGATAIELVRASRRTTGDVALALMFYGGIAGGALLIKLAGGTSGTLVAYLFGSLATVSAADVATTAVLAAVVLVAGLVLRPALFAVSNDEEFARASGLPVRAVNVVLAALGAITVTTAMRVVGLLLVSALMIVPVAIAQMLSSSFRRTMAIACGIGMAVCLAGLVLTYVQDLPPGATIVVIAIGIYAIVAVGKAVGNWRRRATNQPRRKP